MFLLKTFLSLPLSFMILLFLKSIDISFQKISQSDFLKNQIGRSEVSVNFIGYDTATVQSFNLHIYSDTSIHLYVCVCVCVLGHITKGKKSG